MILRFYYKLAIIISYKRTLIIHFFVKYLLGVSYIVSGNKRVINCVNVFFLIISSESVSLINVETIWTCRSVPHTLSLSGWLSVRG